MADRTYVEPLTPEFVARSSRRERPDAMLPRSAGDGAQTYAVTLAEDGTLDRFGVELIGAKLGAIKTPRTGTSSPRPWRGSTGDAKGFFAAEPRDVAACTRAHKLGFLSSSPVLHARRHGRVHRVQPEELETAVRWGCTEPRGQILVEESDDRLEGVRARGHAATFADNVVIICSIENFDDGVHTARLDTVAPAQTLTDKEYQRMRDASPHHSRDRSSRRAAPISSSARQSGRRRMVVIEITTRSRALGARLPRPRAFPSPRSPRNCRGVHP